jgi:rhamnopyranosyl-N-acetylglucosaminyl-diphospho-decaprenol beta-1,3/1,4-galactofuranosyltransferase
MMSTVCAVVVTYNRKELLARCLEALQSQTRPVDTILVVDNLSTDGTLDLVAAEFPTAEVLALTENLGGAGGFYQGMKHAFEQGYDWLWIMDDDGTPAEDCLEKLLVHEQPNRVLVPLQKDSGGTAYGVWNWNGFLRGSTDEVLATGATAVTGQVVFSFVGPLISRQVIQQVGLPQHDLFIRFDDVEYSLRILKQQPKLQVVAVTDAIFYHGSHSVTREVNIFGRRSYRSNDAAWKTYYNCRNNLWTLQKMGSPRRHYRVFWGQMLRHLIGDLVYEPDRWHRGKLRLQALWDAKRGRLGKRI